MTMSGEEAIERRTEEARQEREHGVDFEETAREEATPAPEQAAGTAPAAKADVPPDEGGDESADGAGGAREEADVVEVDAAALRARIEELEALNRELSDRYVRLAADFDNFRRRARQNEEARVAAASEALMTDLLPILDNFHLAIAAAGDALNEPFGQGVTLIYQQLNDVLRRHGLEPIAAEGQPFDPNTMEAVATGKATEDIPDGHVVEEYRRGYKLKGKLLRPSQVKVAQAH